MAIYSYHTTKWGVSWRASYTDESAHLCELADCDQGTVYGPSAPWKEWSQHWNIARFMPGGSHRSSHKNTKNSICKFVRTCWTNTRLKVTVSWIASLLVIKCGDITASSSWTSSPWSGNMCTIFWARQGRGNPSGLSVVQTNHQLWLLHHDAGLAEGSNFQKQARKKDNPSLARLHTSLKTVDLSAR